jgi:hypothetical protein
LSFPRKEQKSISEQLFNEGLRPILNINTAANKPHDAMWLAADQGPAAIFTMAGPTSWFVENQFQSLNSQENPLGQLDGLFKQYLPSKHARGKSMDSISSSSPYGYVPIIPKMPLDAFKQVQTPEGTKFECSMCSKQFTRRSTNARDHWFEHWQIHAFSCDKCSKTFTRSSVHKRHIKSCTGKDNDLSADTCDSSASQTLSPNSGQLNSMDASHPLSPGAGHRFSMGASHPLSPGAGHFNSMGASHPLSPGAGHLNCMDASHPLSPGAGHLNCMDASHPLSPGAGHFYAVGAGRLRFHGAGQFSLGAVHPLSPVTWSPGADQLLPSETDTAKDQLKLSFSGNSQSFDNAGCPHSDGAFMKQLDSPVSMVEVGAGHQPTEFFKFFDMKPLETYFALGESALGSLSTCSSIDDFIEFPSPLTV